MENELPNSHWSGRRKVLTIMGAIVSATFFGERALAAKKPPAKKIVKKPVKKAPPKPVAKPTAKPAPSPSSSPTSTPSASPSPSATPTPAATPTPSPSALTPPADAKVLTVAGKNLTVGDLSIGSTTAATFPKNGATTTVLVTRIDEKNFVALKPICTHAGGPVELSGGSLLCTWHFSRFNQRTGAVINGPAADALPKENVALYGEVLYYIP